MRKLITRGLLVGATTVAATFGLLGSAPASASHLCEYTLVNDPQQWIGYDDPTTGAVGVVYICAEGIVTCEVGGGVHIRIDGSIEADPVLYPPCEGAGH